MSTAEKAAAVGEIVAAIGRDHDAVRLDEAAREHGVHGLRARAGEREREERREENSGEGLRVHGGGRGG